ncbi:MAG: transglutaminase-like domain-containing protein, partial [bacterium]
MRIIRRSRWIVFVLLITLTACSGVRLFQNSGTKSKGKTMDSSAGPLASKRAFEFQYVANVSVDGNHEPTVHIPVPEDSPWQTIRSIDFEAPVEPDIYHDRDYGNKIARFELESSDDTQTVRMTFRVKRKQRKLQVPGTISTRSFENSPYYSRFTTHHPYMETNSRIKNMAQKIKGKSETYMAQARNLYDRIRKMMSYDKSGKGWGRGDISYCLNVGKGNCTDFHTLFTSLARESD